MYLYVNMLIKKRTLNYEETLAHRTFNFLPDEIMQSLQQSL